MRTYVAKGEEAEALKVGADWFVVDATNQVLGRLATKVARMLMGKDKAAFTPYLDSGDHVVVINADKIRMTGPERVVSAVSLRSEVQDQVWTFHLDALNMQAFAPLGGAGALLGSSAIRHLPGL